MNKFLLIGELNKIKIPHSKNGTTPMLNAGVMLNRRVISRRVFPDYIGQYKVLRDVLEPSWRVDQEFNIDDEALAKWRFLKSGKSVAKFAKKTGEHYTYKCGAMPFPDSLDKPSRTMITGEGAKSASRFTHLIKAPFGGSRRLMPVELERLNMFPDDFTIGLRNPKRGFLMGNALVVGVVETIGKHLSAAIRECSSQR